MSVITRVRLGFAAIAMLLLMVGATSYFEFRRLHTAIEEVTSERNQRNGLTEELLASIYKQNSIVSSYMLTDSIASFELNSSKCLEDISKILKKIAQYETHKEELNKIEEAISKYLLVVQIPFIESVVVDEDRYFWYSSYLVPAQKALTESVLIFLKASQKDLTTKALVQLDDIYRSDLKVLITILACMVIIFMFYMLIRVFYLVPIINIKNGLEAYITGGNEYDVKDDGIDEVKKINYLIEQVIQNNDRNIEDNNN